MAKDQPRTDNLLDDLLEDETPVQIPEATPAPPSSAAASALGGATEVRPVEAWAEAKAMLPMELRGRASGAAAINPQYWKFAAARAIRRWQDGQQTTEAEFDAAVGEALGASFR